jgi:isoquinoline 1-oxidoreductase alpha subunit
MLSSVTVSLSITDQAFQQRQPGILTILIFAASVLFVFLLLAGQYESWNPPLAVVLIVPMCLLAAVSGLMLRGMSMDILSEIGFVVLVDLVTKHVTLIVEFAKQAEDAADGIASAPAQRSTRQPSDTPDALRADLGKLPKAGQCCREAERVLRATFYTFGNNECLAHLNLAHDFVCGRARSIGWNCAATGRMTGGMLRRPERPPIPRSRALQVRHGAGVATHKGASMISLTINGAQHRIDAAPDTPLLWAIRDHLNLTGTKFGCGMALCGACTVHVNGTPTRSCQTQIGDVADRQITTIEGVQGEVAHAVQAAWQKLDVVQCGYCQSGQIMSAIGLLSQNRKPTDADVNDAMDGNVCRCATYVRIRAAIHEAAATLA